MHMGPGPVRTFVWWFGIGCLMTLSVLMVQGGVRDLVYGSPQAETGRAFFTFAITIGGGGLLAGCTALILNRIR